MAEILQFVPKPKPAPTVEAVSERAREEIMSQWEKFARGNRLNEYFTSSTAMYCKGGVNYLEDLNALSVIEQRIGLDLQICAPGFGGPDQLGWIAAFRLNGHVVCTTFLPFEAYARALAILLFLKVKRDLQ